MKKLGLVVVALALTACGQDKVNLDTTSQQASYTLGYKSGEQLKMTAPDIDVDAFVAGLRAGATGDNVALDDEQMEKALEDFREEMMAKAQERMEKAQAEFAKKAPENLAKAEAFLEENAEKEGVVTLESGVQYIVEKSGDANGASPTLNDMVVAHYTGTLLDGTVFDSSVERGQPATFPLGSVIEGWQVSLVNMHVGDKWKLFIPPALAYGESGAGDQIGPNELLTFEVELIDVIQGDSEE